LSAKFENRRNGIHVIGADQWPARLPARRDLVEITDEADGRVWLVTDRRRQSQAKDAKLGTRAV
jgi:hypothetical protein